MEVRPGYKKTEMGVIPEEWDVDYIEDVALVATGQTRLPGFHGEWEVKTLGDLFNFSGGYSASRSQLSTEGHCYLHYGDIHGATKTCVDARADYQDIPKLNIPLKRVSPGSLLKDGDVVFVDASEDDEGTSKHVVVVNKDSVPFISGPAHDSRQEQDQRTGPRVSALLFPNGCRPPAVPFLRCRQKGLRNQQNKYP